MVGGLLDFKVYFDPLIDDRGKGSILGYDREILSEVLEIMREVPTGS